MKLTKKTLFEAIHGDELEIISSGWGELLTMIESNPFSERISHLLTHQEIGQIKVRNNHGELSAPNCLGTAFFVAGVGALQYPYHAYSDELDPHLVQPEKEKLIDLFRAHYERRVPGAFIFSYSVQQDGWHAGIYIGSIGEEHVAFAQHGHGGKFCFETIARNYVRPNYYIPSTLVKIQTPALA
ncbi:MAG: hypothetical protein PHG25_03455 [Candidatus Pacebacteria bacterium]|nr:hypothetical protein [Candidatus Paceibacterota bacterium]